MRRVLFWGLFFTSYHLQADYTRDSLGKTLLGTALAPTPLLALRVDTSALLISSLYPLASRCTGTSAHIESNSFFLLREGRGSGTRLRSACNFQGGSGFPGDELGQAAFSPL